jgi:hypothetical protein
MRRLLILLPAAALLPLTLTFHADADVADRHIAASSPPPKKKVEQRHKEWIRLTGQILRHHRRFAHLKVRDSIASTGGTMRAARAAEEYACVVRTNRSGVIAYPPLRAAAYGNSYSHRWMLFVYRVDNARTLGTDATQQQQFEMCAVGGGHTWNDWAPQSGTKRLNWILSSKIRAHCTKWWQIFGRECADFD